jgi:VIT1/CCC1 family predicted Fe2+/Mn2+ transporter
MPTRHHERHNIERSAWLRAAVLGANDGILSTASLVLGVAAAQADASHVMTAGIAGVVSGAMSMAAGEYVSVKSQADAEHANIERERHELATDGEAERRELTMIYVQRGLDRALAEQVADQLHAHDALAAHARDELGITEQLRARPLQAAWSSAASFSVGGLLPLLVAGLAPARSMIPSIALASLVSLALLGALSARAAGAKARSGAARVTFWGVLAMVISLGIGRLAGGMF